MWTPADEATLPNKWCRDCAFASRKEVINLKLKIYCGQFDEVFSSFESSCDFYIEDSARRKAIGQGLIRLLKKKKQKEGEK